MFQMGIKTFYVPTCTYEIILYDLNLKDLITRIRHGPNDQGFIQDAYVIGMANLQGSRLGMLI